MCQELELLGLLYGLFQKFLRFNERFRDTLWAEVDLESETKEVGASWDHNCTYRLGLQQSVLLETTTKRAAWDYNGTHC